MRCSTIGAASFASATLDRGWLFSFGTAWLASVSLALIVSLGLTLATVA